MSKMNKISNKELQKHNNYDDLWISINNKVYDLTKYQNEHPGSDTILQDVAGTDATQDFLDVGHSNEAVNKMKELEIGLLEKTKEDLNEKSENIIDKSNSVSNIWLSIPLFLLLSFIYVYCFINNTIINNINNNTEL